MGLDQYAFSRNKNSKLNGTVTENVRITSAGNVGINNTDTGSLLDVRGDAVAHGILTLSTA